jgi:hypothetical protein
MVCSSGSACTLSGGAFSRQSRARNASSRHRSWRRNRYPDSNAKGSRSASAAALSESPASSFTNHRHTSEAVNVCRGNTSASNMENVRPQPPRWPRLEQNTRCPRQVWPSLALGSLPSERLCRFNAPTQPQCGHGDCLREKAACSTPGRREQNEKVDETSRLAARKPRSSSSFLRHCLTAQLGSIGFRKRQDGADGTITTLNSYSRPGLRVQFGQNTALLTTALRLLTATIQWATSPTWSIPAGRVPRAPFPWTTTR